MVLETLGFMALEKALLAVLLDAALPAAFCCDCWAEAITVHCSKAARNTMMHGMRDMGDQLSPQLVKWNTKRACAVPQSGGQNCSRALPTRKAARADAARPTSA